VGNSAHTVVEMMPLGTQFHLMIGINQLNFYDINCYKIIKDDRFLQLAAAKVLNYVPLVIP
jgi:hypothetical protein